MVADAIIGHQIASIFYFGWGEPDRRSVMSTLSGFCCLDRGSITLP